MFQSTPAYVNAPITAHTPTAHTPIYVLSVAHRYRRGSDYDSMSLAELSVKYCTSTCAFAVSITTFVLIILTYINTKEMKWASQ